MKKNTRYVKKSDYKFKYVFLEQSLIFLAGALIFSFIEFLQYYVTNEKTPFWWLPPCLFLFIICVVFYVNILKNIADYLLRDVWWEEKK